MTLSFGRPLLFARDASDCDRIVIICAAFRNRARDLPTMVNPRPTRSSNDNVERLSGRKPMSVGDFARAHADALNPK
jgi:hypothetical protein